MITTVAKVRAALATLPLDRRFVFTDSLDIGTGAAAVCLDTTGARSMQGEEGTPSVGFILRYLNAWQKAPATPVRCGDDFAKEIGL